MQNFSQTQVANFMTIAGLIVMLVNQFGLVWDTNEVAFILAATWAVGSTIYNFIQRWTKGDITLGGRRIKN